MIRNQGPGKTPRIGLLNNAAKPIQEIIPVRFIPKDLTTFNPSGDNVMQSARSIYPRLARHAQVALAVGLDVDEDRRENAGYGDGTKR